MNKQQRKQQIQRKRHIEQQVKPVRRHDKYAVMFEDQSYHWKHYNICGFLRPDMRSQRHNEIIDRVSSNNQFSHVQVVDDYPLFLRRTDHHPMQRVVMMFADQSRYCDEFQNHIMMTMWGGDVVTVSDYMSETETYYGQTFETGWALYQECYDDSVFEPWSLSKFKKHTYQALRREILVFTELNTIWFKPFFIAEMKRQGIDRPPYYDPKELPI